MFIDENQCTESKKVVPVTEVNVEMSTALETFFFQFNNVMKF